MIIHTEKSKESTKQLLEIISDFNKVSWFKVNVNISTVLYILAGNNSKMKFENSAYNSIKTRKYLE